MKEFEVKLTQEIRSNSGWSVAAGSRAWVVEQVGLNEYLIEVTEPDASLVGGVRFDVAVVEREQFEPLKE